MNVNQMWNKAFGLMKKITGDVDINSDGNLQEQVGSIRSDLEALKEEIGDLTATPHVKISELDELLSALSTDDELIINDGGITKKVKASLLADSISKLFAPNGGAGLHNSIYRGKNLGGSLTSAQKNAISNQTFDDMWIGDYWVINGVTWRIADFNYWLRSGDTECKTPHIVIVPDSCLYNAQMNSTNITTGAYVGSKMYTTNLDTAKTTIQNAFGSDNILTHREYLANATKATSDPSYESAGSWYDSTVELMTECMVYGGNIFHNVEVNGAIPTNYTIGKSQLSLFRLDASRICNSAGWWLRDVVSSACFADVSYIGNAYYYNASGSNGVRPAFGIKA